MSVFDKKYDIAFAIRTAKTSGVLPFWGHHSSSSRIDRSCLSQWWPSEFRANDKVYSSAEQYMMAEKARLFKDADAEQSIMSSTDPRMMKKIGRDIRNFNQNIWDMYKYSIVFAGNMFKYKSNCELSHFLVSTSPCILVEASPVDRVWGVGLSMHDYRIDNPVAWKGTNLLGFALMHVRDELMELP